MLKHLFPLANGLFYQFVLVQIYFPRPFPPSSVMIMASDVSKKHLKIYFIYFK
jgi:hypothetical protein